MTEKTLLLRGGILLGTKKTMSWQKELHKTNVLSQGLEKPFRSIMRMLRVVFPPYLNPPKYRKFVCETHLA